jgi:hypothetical protein
MTRERTQLVQTLLASCVLGLSLAHRGDMTEKYKGNQRHPWFVRKERKKSRLSFATPTKIGAALAKDDS